MGIISQETPLSLTNCATHLCKCNDVADLTSVIKIHLKKNDSSHRPFKVTQGHWNRHESTPIYDLLLLLLVFFSNFFPKTHHFRDIRLQKCCELEIRVRASVNVIGNVTIR